MKINYYQVILLIIHKQMKFFHWLCPHSHQTDFKDTIARFPYNVLIVCKCLNNTKLVKIYLGRKTTEKDPFFV